MTIKSFKALLFMSALACNAVAQTISLPAPVTTGGTPLSEALASRKSIRQYDTARTLSEQTISDLLWSAAGINRPEEGKRTNPTAINAQDIDLYLFTSEGVYLYDHKANTLIEKASGDHRTLIAGTPKRQQKFVTDAPVSILMVAELGRYKDYTPSADSGCYNRTALMGAVDAGIVSQNINLFCAANGLATVTRATMDSQAIISLLGLSPTALPLLNNPVGYPR